MCGTPHAPLMFQMPPQPPFRALVQGSYVPLLQGFLYLQGSHPLVKAHVYLQGIAFVPSSTPPIFKGSYSAFVQGSGLPLLQGLLFCLSSRLLSTPSSGVRIPVFKAPGYPFFKGSYTFLQGSCLLLLQVTAFLQNCSLPFLQGATCLQGSSLPFPQGTTFLQGSSQSLFLQGTTFIQGSSQPFFPRDYLSSRLLSTPCAGFVQRSLEFPTHTCLPSEEYSVRQLKAL